jgi:hypothetical protein
VFVSVDREQPRVHAWIAVRAGSRHDPAHSTGLAHYLEHMMFKGSPRLGTLDAAAEAPHQARIAALYDRLPSAAPGERPQILAAIDEATQATAATAVPNELDRLYAGLGILDVNAFTTDDATVYLADLPAQRLAAWARIEAERLARPVFRLFYPSSRPSTRRRTSASTPPRIASTRPCAARCSLPTPTARRPSSATPSTSRTPPSPRWSRTTGAGTCPTTPP